MFTYASFPIYFPATDVKVADIEIRVFGSGDDRSMWDVQYLGADDRWHTAAPEQSKAILDHIETTEPLTSSNILATANTNPKLAA